MDRVCCTSPGAGSGHFILPRLLNWAECTPPLRAEQCGWSNRSGRHCLKTVSVAAETVGSFLHTRYVTGSERNSHGASQPALSRSKDEGSDKDNGRRWCRVCMEAR